MILLMTRVVMHGRLSRGDRLACRKMPPAKTHSLTSLRRWMAEVAAMVPMPPDSSSSNNNNHS